VSERAVSVSVRAFGAKGDGRSDDTRAFILGAAAAENVWVPASATPYVISQTEHFDYAVLLPSKTHIQCQPGAKIQMAPKQPPGVRMFRTLPASHDIEISGCDIDGNVGRAAEQSSNQQNHCIMSYGTDYLSVHDNIIHDCDGDGVYLLGNAFDRNATTPSRHVTVTKNRFYGQFRIAMSLGDVDGATIDNNFCDARSISSDASGGDCIHGEPGLPNFVLRDISITNNSIIGNAGKGNISLTTGSLGSEPSDNFSRNSITGNALNGAGYVVVIGHQYAHINNNKIRNSSDPRGRVPAVISILGCYRCGIASNTVEWDSTAARVPGILVSNDSRYSATSGVGESLVTQNQIVGARGVGVVICSSSSNKVLSNDIRGVTRNEAGYSAGIVVDMSGGCIESATNEITGNTISEMPGESLSLGIDIGSVDRQFIHDNHITDRAAERLRFRKSPGDRK
jgi:hypothetical protein